MRELPATIVRSLAAIALGCVLLTGMFGLIHQAAPDWLGNVVSAVVGALGGALVTRHVMAKLESDGDPPSDKGVEVTG